MGEALRDRLKAAEACGGKKLDLGGMGLRSLPSEVFDFAETLELLNLTQNELHDLPTTLGRLGRLRILFASQNRLDHVPEVVGECAELDMVGFKANRIERVSGAALPVKLRWLILTDNRIDKLPDELGRRPRLQKLMLSGNQLKELPESLAACGNLEMVRMAANDFQQLPHWLLELPKLTWLAMTGNPCAPVLQSVAGGLREVDWRELELGVQLGEGASGWVYRARWQGREVAVKLFKGAVTSDGLPEHEMAANLAAGHHEHLVEALGKVCAHPEGRDGLVLKLLESKFRNLAGPPSFESCTRDVYSQELKLTSLQVSAMARAMASVAAQLHQRGLMHGDFYAHNMVWDGEMDCRLGDFGGASFYETGSETGDMLERLEVRAFGCFLEELLERCGEKPERLQVLRDHCFREQVRERPAFAEIVEELHSIS